MTVVPPARADEWVEKLSFYPLWVIFMHGINRFDFRGLMAGEVNVGMRYPGHTEYEGHYQLRVTGRNNFTGRMEFWILRMDFEYDGHCTFTLISVDSLGVEHDEWRSDYVTNLRGAGEAADDFRIWLDWANMSLVQLET